MEMQNVFELMCDRFIAKLKSEVPTPMPAEVEATIRMGFLGGATSTMKTIHTLAQAGDSESIEVMRKMINDMDWPLEKMQRGKEDECVN